MTCDTLHAHTQVLGKLAVELAPPEPELHHGALRLTAEDLKRMALVDAVIPEPLGGAQRDPQAAIQAVGEAVAEALGALTALDGATLKARRRDKYLEMGREGLG